ncbi:MAG: tRNA lysidine(34) synthetase TilS [Alphaproteobacteria bacterium]|nr:tRNA lysidine(34) synthetase TilS [Alphaproteobacteria bacterium]
MEGAVAGSMTPLAAAEFERLMVRFAPFEAGPHLAVACSGGGDSMALAILADRWAYARGGNVTALIVDHRLRPESASEAAGVGRALAALGIAHRILVCADAPPAGNLEDAARRARYGLLEAWCEDNGVLHLLTAHQRDDQAETLLMRLARGSGLDGLAGIAPVSIRRTCRVLRPLLTIPPERLRATLRDHGVAHVEDPMNRDPAFQRVRLRAARAFLAEEGLSAERLAATTARLARARSALATMVTATLARAVALDPLGCARVDVAALEAAPAEVGLRALAAVLATVGGADYPVRLEQLERLYESLPSGIGGGRTLGGCQLIAKTGHLLVCREAAAVAGRQAAPPGARLHWDGRFAIALPEDAPADLSVGPLGGDAAARLAAEGGDGGVPSVIRVTLPALFDAEGLAAAPLLGWCRPGIDAKLAGREIAVFAPRLPLSGLWVTVV